MVVGRDIIEPRTDGKSWGIVGFRHSQVVLFPTLDGGNFDGRYAVVEAIPAEFFIRAEREGDAIDGGTTLILPD